MNRIEYELFFSADPKQIELARQKIEQLEKQLEPFKQADHFKQLSRELDEFHRKAARPDWFNGLTEGIHNLTGEIPIVGQLIDGLFTGAGFGVAAVTTAIAAVKHGYEEAAQAEQKIIALDQALANRNALNKDNRQALHGQAEEVETKTGISSEQVMGVQAKLLQFGAAPENVNKLTAGIIDLAGALGGDIDRASIIYIRALNGNFQSAHRLGLEIDRTGAASKQMAQLLSESARVGGGALERLHDSSKGAWQDMANEWKHVFQNLGSDLKPIGDFLARLLQGLAMFLNFQPFKGRVDHGMSETAGDPDKTQNRLGGGVREQLDEDMQGVAGGANSATAALDHLIENLNQLAQVADKLRAADLAETGAKINADVASGKITKEEGQRQMAVAQAQAEREAAQDQINEANAKAQPLADMRDKIQAKLADINAPVDESKAAAAPAMQELAGLISATNKAHPNDVQLTAPTNSRELSAFYQNLKPFQGFGEKGNAYDRMIELLEDPKKGGKISTQFENVSTARGPGIEAQFQLDDINNKIAANDANKKVGEAHLTTASSNETAGTTDADRAALARKDRANEDAERADAELLSVSARTFEQRKAAIEKRHQAEIDAINDQIRDGQHTAEEIRALDAKKAASEAAQAAETRKLNEEQQAIKDRPAILNAEAQMANARNDAQRRAALVAERKAALAAQQHELDAEQDPDKQAALKSKMDLTAAQFDSQIRELDLKHLHLDDQKPDVDKYAKVGLFAGGQSLTLDYAQRTADAAGKLAAWVAAGAPVSARNGSGGKGATYQ